MPSSREKRPIDVGQVFKRLDLRDLSLLPLLVSNALAIWWAAHEHLSLQTVMMIYWAQSVTIGMVNVLRILALRDYSTEDFRMGGPLSPSAGTKMKVAGFFAFHYGFFHVVYLAFILGAMTRGRVDVDVPFVLYGAALFAGTDLAALALHWNAETRGRNIGKVMFAPYARIVPMHLAIIFGGFVGYHPGLTLGIFQGLKTAADVIAHLIVHRRRDHNRPDEADPA
ncbi:hypothetical protein FJY68_00930 [candidate division WOR-3 bacterium]|uniref:Uncharacterized protein n=1 Tax=candidate division WOR-3 bacterium TaxID=2052148 RepID=A0A937XB38_UNCW3|nr:hypothetical protein [candidate division WOR-3 bacterium]